MIIYYLFQCLSPVIHVLGLIIGIWAFRKCYKKGYIVISVYFGLALFSLLAMPQINRMVAKRYSPSIPKEKYEEMNREVEVIYQRYFEDEGLPPQSLALNLNFPLGPIVLVSGLWILARKETKSEPEHGDYSENAG